MTEICRFGSGSFGVELMLYLLVHVRRNSLKSALKLKKKSRKDILICWCLQVKYSALKLVSIISTNRSLQNTVYHIWSECHKLSYQGGAVA